MARSLVSKAFHLVPMLVPNDVRTDASSSVLNAGPNAAPPSDVPNGANAANAANARRSKPETPGQAQGSGSGTQNGGPGSSPGNSADHSNVGDPNEDKGNDCEAKSSKGSRLHCG